ncbi:hypothetical protein GCM10010365_64220 [Streptomyces poonensis]|uniref:Uncharacterized protein n=1 Tax=Streptomyces poonensis TaxID=68255 RepID=A0A918UUV8_9ACTN|nr:hypothetical protein GCM10010365_64220 [Streptomyces poonensis]GLJ89304.1 hypothetical protein GCM10017589_19040 [Streptomyces poonensis]
MMAGRRLRAVRTMPTTTRRVVHARVDDVAAGVGVTAGTAAGVASATAVAVTEGAVDGVSPAGSAAAEPPAGWWTGADVPVRVSSLAMRPIIESWDE